MREQLQPERPDTEGPPKLSRRMVLLAALGLSVSPLLERKSVEAETELSQEERLAIVEGIQEHYRLIKEPVTYHEFSREHEPTLRPILVQLNRYAVQIEQLLNSKLDLSQLRAQTDAVTQTLLGAVEERLGSILRTGNVHVDTVRAFENHLVPWLARHGIYLYLSPETVSSAGSQGEEPYMAGFYYIVRGGWKIDSVEMRTVEQFWNQPSFEYQEIRVGEALRSETGTQLFEFTDLRRATDGLDAFTERDTMVWEGVESGASEMAAQLAAGEQQGDWARLRDASLEFYEQQFQQGKLGPEHVVRIAQQHCLAVQVPELLAEPDVAAALTGRAEQQIRVHEASHLYFERQRAFQQTMPILAEQTTNRAQLDMARQRSSIRAELGAVLGEAQHLPSNADMLERLCTYVMREQQRPEYAHAATWILDAIVTTAKNNPDYFGIEIRQDSPLSKEMQCWLQFNVLAKQENHPAILSIIEALIEEYVASYEDDFLLLRESDEKRSAHFPLPTTVTLPKKDADSPSTLGIAAAVTAISGAFFAAAKWRKNRMDAKRQQQTQDKTKQPKKRKSKKR